MLNPTDHFGFLFVNIIPVNVRLPLIVVLTFEEPIPTRIPTVHVLT